MIIKLDAAGSTVLVNTDHIVKIFEDPEDEEMTLIVFAQKDIASVHVTETVEEIEMIILAAANGFPDTPA